MKKEGIQTRNRKLSSKSKKKKNGGCLGLGVMGDMIKASGHLDLDNKSFHSGFGAPMGKSRLLSRSSDQLTAGVSSGEILFSRSSIGANVALELCFSSRDFWTVGSRGRLLELWVTFFERYSTVTLVLCGLGPRKSPCVSSASNCQYHTCSPIKTIATLI